ncbi:MAG: N-acetylmuramoyl-L-alanine amidase [Armatimonadetes bacterium]|nr:N-acetylmuramoyl-L-alanine amidase [Armatimonadota bacterium]
MSISAIVSFAIVSLVAPKPSVPVSAPQPQAFVAPGFAKLEWYVSPNFDERPSGTVVDTIVLHHTANGSLEGTSKWFASTESRVSSHYTIGKDGSILQHVSTFSRAWHAGVSKDIEGRTGVNAFSIGIEIVNAGDGVDKFTEEQIKVVGYLIGAMRFRFPTLKYITSHEYIAMPPGRKPDPKGFPWERLQYLGLKLVYGLQKPPTAAEAFEPIWQASPPAPAVPVSETARF